jgi:hypothetical protein
MNIRKMLITVLFALSLAMVGHTEQLELEHGATRGSVLFSPAVFLNAGTLTECRVVNVSQKSRKITAQIFRGYAGMDVTEVSGCRDQVSPGTTCAALYTNQTGGAEDVYCLITVEGSKTTVRGVLSIRGTCDLTCQTSVAVEAR